MQRECICVALGERSYDIFIEPGSLNRLPSMLPDELRGRGCAVVTHRSITQRYGEMIRQRLQEAHCEAFIVAVPDGEQHKDINTAMQVIDALVEANLNRTGFVVAVGGGMIGDLAGFVASVYMRGIDFIQVPTTLLAQVDASVGGKVAVNHPRAKNLIGAFHQPRLVCVDPLTLKTLPAREFRSGLAEVIKYGVIADAALFGYLEDNLDSILQLEPSSLTHIISRSCAIKAAIVARDERETGERAFLNYGHTVGHAIEACEYGKMTHGEAIAIGMTAAARIARRLERIDDDFITRQEELLRRASLPTRWKNGNIDAALNAMRLDKKAQAGKLRFVLPSRLGSVEVVDDIPFDAVRSALEEVAA